MIAIIIVSLLSGIVSGMGMGGGTLLIPLLTLFCSVSQIQAQCLNLLSFIPTSMLATGIHIKNKLVKFPYLLLSIPALISSVLTSFCAHLVDADFLRIGFGVFLAGLGMLNLVSLFLKKSAEMDEKNKI